MPLPVAPRTSLPVRRHRELHELGLTDGLPTLPDIEFVMMHDAQHAAAVEFAATVIAEI